MLRITPDTNVLVSAIISKGNEYKLLKSSKFGKVRIILSLEILKEFKEVINRPKFGFSSHQIENVFKQLLDISEIVIPSTNFDVIKEDPADNKILDCAFAGKADYLVSGDNHLLKLKKFKDIKIIKTKEFLDILKRE